MCLGSVLAVKPSPNLKGSTSKLSFSALNLTQVLCVYQFHHEGTQRFLIYFFMFNNNKNFDVDLAKGQRNEKRIADILGLGEDKIEIKTEYNFWQKSGNLCIELESYKKPSGLKSTKAKYWVQSFNCGEIIIGFTAVPVPILKKIVSKFLIKNKKRKHEVIRMLGDNYASKCVLIPMTEFIDLWRSIEIKNKTTKAN